MILTGENQSMRRETCHLVHYTYHTDRPRIETRPPRWTDVESTVFCRKLLPFNIQCNRSGCEDINQNLPLRKDSLFEDFSN